MHEHHHTHETARSREETLALLNYMLHHNRSHAEELHELAHNLSEEETSLLREAVKDFNRGNEKLAAILAMMKGE